MSIADKIETKMTMLEGLMNSQGHLKTPSIVVDLLDSISMYWAHMSDEDKDYVDCAKYAMENKMEWII